MDTISASQPSERVFELLASDPVNSLRKNDKVTVRPAPYYSEKDVVAIQREHGIYLRRYDKFCRNLKILGRVVAVDSSQEQDANPSPSSSQIGEGGSYTTSDVQNLIQTLASQDRVTARSWAKHLTSHIRKVSRQ